jgi:diketogulonate reductase-like aldo/keto reductase
MRKSLQDLRTTYVDLVLIHWPGVKGLKLDDERNSDLRRSTYQTLEKLHSEGLIKLIGVSNYNIKHLNELLSYARVKPHLLQVKYYNFQKVLNIF